jgi:hypothetical protein
MYIRKMFMCFIVILTVAFQVHLAFGACCLSGGCADTPPLICEQSGGSYIPGLCSDPGICQATPLTTAVPTMTEWGMIIFISLAGVGSVYYLRRYRRAES